MIIILSELPGYNGVLKFHNGVFVFFSMQTIKMTVVTMDSFNSSLFVVRAHRTLVPFRRLFRRWTWPLNYDLSGYVPSQSHPFLDQIIRPHSLSSISNALYQQNKITYSPSKSKSKRDRTEMAPSAVVSLIETTERNKPFLRDNQSEEERNADGRTSHCHKQDGHQIIPSSQRRIGGDHDRFRSAKWIHSKIIQYRHSKHCALLQCLSTNDTV